MKKIVSTLMILAVMVSCTTPALADAMEWDMDRAGYNVYVLTPDGGLNIRTGPGTQYAKVFETPIPDYTKLYIEWVSGNWGQTLYNGQYGWVYLPQTTTEPPRSGWTEQAANYDIWVTTPDGGLNMRAGPSTSYAKVRSSLIPDYTRLHITKTSGQWGYTEYDGVSGWVCLVDTTTKNPNVEQAAPAQTNPAPAPVETPPAEEVTPPAEETEAPETQETTEELPAVQEDTVEKTATMDHMFLLVGLLLVVIVLLSIILLLMLKKKKTDN